jgi:NitT/TauT family transport system permease protein
VIGSLLLWHLLSTTFVDPSFLPPPTQVAAAFVELIADGTLFQHILVTLGRVFSGWLLGSLIAAPIGLLAGASLLMRSALDPFIHFFRFIPAIAFVSLFLVWFGTGEMSKILLVAYAAGFLVVVNAATGAASIPDDKINAARCLGASTTQVFRHVTVPAAVSGIFLGMRLALAASFLVIVAAESLAADTGLGYLVWNSRLYFRIDWMFVGIICLGLLGFVADRAWRALGSTVLRRFLGDSARY